MEGILKVSAGIASVGAGVFWDDGYSKFACCDEAPDVHTTNNPPNGSFVITCPPGWPRKPGTMTVVYTGVTSTFCGGTGGGVEGGYIEFDYGCHGPFNVIGTVSGAVHPAGMPDLHYISYGSDEARIEGDIGPTDCLTTPPTRTATIIMTVDRCRLGFRVGVNMQTHHLGNTITFTFVSPGDRFGA